MSNSPRPDASAQTSDGGDATVLGKYRLMAKLGQGGMADVYLAIARGALGVNKLVVIKQLRATLASNPDFVTMFLDEARLAVRLSHPNVVHTYEAGERDGQCFLVMEYLEGQAVDEFVGRARAAGVTVPAGVWVRVVVDALAGLHYAHELCDYDGTPLQIAHRDVSPQNIFVTYDGQVKLVDFGIAKARLNATVTDAGELKGKVCYMAPEHVLGRPSDRRSDVFAMGVVLWELLAGGRRLFAGDAGQALHKVLHAPIPPLSSVRADASPALEAIVARALERDPERRYQTADEMRAALEGVLLSGGAFTCAEDVGRALVGVAGGLRDKVRRRVQGFMAGADDPNVRDRMDTGATPVNFARLASVRLGAGLPLLMTPSDTFVASKPPPGAAPPGPPRSRAGLRRAGYALMALAALAAGGGALALRGGWAEPARPAAAASNERDAALLAALRHDDAAANGPAAKGEAAGAGAARGAAPGLSADAAAKDRAASAAREPMADAAREPMADAAREPMANAAREPAANAARERAARDAAKEPAARDAARELAAKELAAKELAAKEPAPARPAGRGRRRPAGAARQPSALAAPPSTPAALPSTPSAPAVPAATAPAPPRPKVKLVDEEKRSLRLDE